MSEMTSRERFLTAPAPKLTLLPAPKPTAESERTAEEINQRVARYRKGDPR